MNKKISFPEYDFNYIQTTKFTKSFFGITFLEPLSKELLAEKKLLIKLMRKSIADYPQEQDFSNYLKDLYDTRFSSGINFFGKATVTNIKTTFINQEYVYDGINLFEKIVETLNKIINEPGFIKKGDNLEVDEEKLSREKRAALANIKSASSNKVSYAINNVLEKMHENDEYGLQFKTLAEETENITGESLLKAYKQLLNAKKVIIYIGNMEYGEVLEIIKKKMVLSVPTNIPELSYVTRVDLEKVTQNEIIVPQKIKQSVLILGYKTEIVMNDKLEKAYNLFTYMLGGYFNSTLFQIIREEHSLAYYVSASNNVYSGDLIIYAGINKKNYQKTLHLILDIISKYQEGNFTSEDEENLMRSKKSFEKSIYEANDAIEGAISDSLEDIIGRKFYSDEEAISIYNNITLEDIQEVANCLKLEIIYLLQGDLEDE